MQYKEYIITWQDQLEMMEFIASANSERLNYDNLIEYTRNAFAEKYKNIKKIDRITYEPIPDKKLNDFMEWFESDE